MTRADLPHTPARPPEPTWFPTAAPRPSPLRRVPAGGPVPGALVAAVVAAVADETGLDRPWDDLLREFVVVAVRRITQRGEPDQRWWHRWGRRFRLLGAAAFAAGADPQRLLRGYAAGGQAVLRQLTPPDRVHCAEAVLSCVAEMSRLTVAGFAAAGGNGGDPRQRARALLLDRLLSGRRTDPRALADLARAAHWPVPDRVTLVALDRVDEHCPVPAVNALVDLDAPQPRVLLPGDPRALPSFGTARAAVGPTVPLARAAVSLAWARRTLDLVRLGLLPDAPVTRYTDRLLPLLLCADPQVLPVTREHCLAPLSGLRPAQRSKLADTLLAWLSTRGNVAAIAADLRVHPQTVRYRLRQLRGHYGDRLDNPHERFTLELTLRADQIARQRR